MSRFKRFFGSKLSALFTKVILKVSVPILNNKIIPLQWSSLGGVVSSKQDNNILMIECENGYLEIKLITSNIWRVRASKTKLPKEHISYAAQEPSSNIPLRVVKEYSKIVLKENKNVLRSDDLIVTVNDYNSTISFARVNGKKLHEDKSSISWSKRGSWAKVQKVYSQKSLHTGFGEKTGKLVKNGKKMIFWNTDPSVYGKYDDPIYQSEPLQVTVHEDGSAHAIFYDNPHYSVIKPRKDSGLNVSYFTEQEPLCYYVLTGPNLKDVSRQIGELNGRLPLPPRWILGYHQCRFSYYPESKVREIAENFRTKNIPCDSIHLDIDYMNGFRCFTWDNERFPDPAKLASDLRDDGFKLISMIDPALKVDPEWDIYNECIDNNFHCRMPNGDPYIGRVWPGKCVFPDFTNPKVRDWWGSLYKRLVDVGIEGIWLDMAEPSTFDLRRTAPNNVQHDLDGRFGNHRDAHNIYGLQFAQATREGLDKLKENHRNFIFVRTAYSGIQRYASSWTGDNFSNWTGLQQSIPMVMNMGLSGQTFVSVDLGGFALDVYPELLIRWYQTGIFYPYCRNHSDKRSVNQEPWAFDEQTEEIIRNIIQFRYQLLPYFYSLLWEASSEGLPMMRPLFMEFPLDKETYNEEWHNTQFMVGDKLLVAPILSKIKKNQQEVTRDIYLPKGKWIDFWTNEQLNGGQTFERIVPINHLPLFIRSGSALPMNPIVNYSEKTVEHPLYLNIYPDTEIKGNIYLDDGITKTFEDEFYNYITIKGHEATREISIELTQSGKIKDLPLTNNFLHIRIFTKKQPIKIRVNDRTVNQENNFEKLSWNKPSDENYIEIIIPEPEFPLSVLVNFS
ncbi:MAG: DUF4968 domain-containing protein [Asgard group archaeon]|nr:DUF4968 domain-containing protein [Asgard group archaeon]